MPLPTDRRIAPTAFPLTSAYICGNCDAVGNSSTECPSCGSNSLHSLAKQLGGDVGEMSLGPNAKPKAGSIFKKAYVAHVPGHKNSEGESAPWVVKQHNTDKILTSYKSETEAKEGLKNMESHKGSVSPLLRRKAEAVPPTAPAPAESKMSVIALEGWEKQRGSRHKRPITFYVTGLSYKDGDGTKIKSFTYNLDKAKAKQFGKFNAEGYAQQMNSPSFGAKAHVEPA